MARDRIKELRRRVYLVLEQGPVGDTRQHRWSTGCWSRSS